MFGFLKNFFRSPGPAQVANGTPAPPPRLTPGVSSVSPAPAPAAHLSPAQPVPAPARPQPTANALSLPLGKVLAGLPPELQSRVRQSVPADATISLALEKVLPQLACGAVRISFGELRQAAPAVFSRESDRDQAQVFLPLAEILTQINPAWMERRHAQKQVEIPAEISAPFDLRGQGLTLSSIPAKGPAVADSAPPSAPLSPRAHPLGATPPAAPWLPSASAPPPKPFLPPAVGIRNTLPLPAAGSCSPRSNGLASSAGMPHPRAAAPSAPLLPPPAVLRMAPMSPAQVPTPPQPTSNGASGPVASGTAPQTSFPKGSSMVLPLRILSEGWPPAVRKLIGESNLAQAQAHMPLEFLEQGLKQGRIALAWKALRAWIQPAVDLPPSPQDSIVIELPLKVIVPHFLARQQPGASGRDRVEVDENIPDLFFGFPQPEAPASTAIPPAPAPREGPEVLSADTNYFAKEDPIAPADATGTRTFAARSPGTKFVAKYAAPNEIVARAAAMEGVAGALIALPDGLMVANQLPADVNSDTLAAFLPQIFNRVSQCTKELRMGELNNLNFTVGNTPWKIFRVNAIFFAAFGRPGQSLPSAKLATLAAELDRKPK